MKIGLIVNPIAGIGAKLAWKGTDDISAAWEVINMGYIAPIWKIINRSLNSISHNDHEWFIGENVEKNLILSNKFNFSSVYKFRSVSDAEDTVMAVKILIDLKVDIIIFAGGDGTAVDIAKNNEEVPIIGIPGGVKIFSPCFLHRPEDLGNFLTQWRGETEYIELFDLDEEEYRRGNAKPKLVGKAIIPVNNQIQGSKMSWNISKDDVIFDGIADRIIEEKLVIDKTILVGSGSTMQHICKKIGISKTLLGVCIISNGKSIIVDANHEDILQIASNQDIDEIWLSPIGSQGHIFGRGNRQIPLDVIKLVGKQNIRLFSTVMKINNTPLLYTDTGDNLIDNQILGFYQVITGYHESIMRKVIL